MTAHPPDIPPPSADLDDDSVAQAHYEKATGAWKKHSKGVASKMNPFPKITYLTSQQLCGAADGVDDGII